MAQSPIRIGTLAGWATIPVVEYAMAASQYGNHGLVPWLMELAGWGIIGGSVVGFAPWLPRWTRWPGWPGLLYLGAMVGAALPGGDSVLVRLLGMVLVGSIGLVPARRMHALDIPSVARAPLYVTAAAAVAWLPGALLGRHGFLPDAVVMAVLAGLGVTLLSVLVRGPWLHWVPLVVSWLPWSHATGAAGRPAMVLLTIDHLRFDAAQELDSLGEVSGLQVRADAHSPSAWAVPAIASVLTGVSPEVHGVDLRPDGTLGVLGAERTTLAEALGEVGYTSAAFVSSPQLRASWGVPRGFDLWVNAADMGLPLALGGRARAAEGRASTVLGRASRWLAHASGDGGWLLWIHLDDLTPPWSEATPPEGLPTDSASLAELMALGAEADEDEQEALAAAYWEEVEALDESLESFFAELPSAAVVVVAGTTGFELFDYGALGAGHAHHDAVTQVPLAIALPAANGSLTVSDQPPSLLDIAPTLVGLGGGRAVMAGLDLTGPMPRRRIVASVGAPAAPRTAAAHRGHATVYVDGDAGTFAVEGPEGLDRDGQLARQAAVTALQRHLAHTEPGVRVPSAGLPPVVVADGPLQALDALTEAPAPVPLAVLRARAEAEDSVSDEAVAEQ